VRRTAAAVAALLALVIAPVAPIVVDRQLNATVAVSRTTVAPTVHAATKILVPVASPAPARASRSTRRSLAAASSSPVRTPSTLTPRSAASGRDLQAADNGSATAKASDASESDRPVNSAGRSLGARDITQYCWTGNRNAAGRWPQLGDVAVLDRSIPFGTVVHIDGLGTYVVRDWIGHGSEFDIYAGRGDCETRASNFGRQHRDVTVEP
jgi:3D (Asp-Asp-Asp) domain-containing protein